MKNMTTTEAKTATREARMGVCSALLTAALSIFGVRAAHAELITNGDFETGNFSGWTGSTTQVTPFQAALNDGLNSATIGSPGNYSWFVRNQPANYYGAPNAATPITGYSAFNGFDGSGGNFTLRQGIAITDTLVSADLSFDYAVQSSYTGSPRVFSVNILDAGGTTQLATVWSLSQPTGTLTAWAPANVAVDVAATLNSLGAGSYQIEFRIDIPQSFTGAAQFALDNVSLAEVYPVCGNGAVEPGEQCDDSNVANGDCCSSTCQYEAMDSPCEDSAYCTVGDKCDGAGACLAGTARNCADADACTADSCDDGMDTCVHAGTPRDAASCYVAPATKFQIKDSDTAGKDKLSWQWSKGDAFTQAHLGNPDTAMGTTYTLCVYDKAASIPSLKASIDIAPSTTLWVSKDPKGLQYKDKAGTSEGVTKAQLKTGDAAKTKVKVSAGGANLVLPAPAGSLFFDQNPNVVVQLVSSAGKCWTSQFTPDDTVKNVAGLFKAQTK